MEQYNVVLLGYPIWHGQAPRIVSTFLERYDFSGKTIVPFCTSHSSGIGSSDESLHALAPDANWLSGQRFAVGTSRSAIEEWLGGLDLPESASPLVRPFDFDTRTVRLNSGVRLIDTAHAYGNEEEIGAAIRNSGIPREEIFVITKLYPDQFSNPEEAIDEALEKLDIGYIDMILPPRNR